MQAQAQGFRQLWCLGLSYFLSAGQPTHKSGSRCFTGQVSTVVRRDANGRYQNNNATIIDIAQRPSGLTISHSNRVHSTCLKKVLLLKWDWGAEDSG